VRASYVSPRVADEILMGSQESRPSRIRQYRNCQLILIRMCEAKADRTDRLGYYRFIKPQSKSKALVAAVTARHFNPSSGINIHARHGNVKEGTNDVEWIKGFGLVMNALDNAGKYSRGGSES
jgi:hypothetical protein